MSWTQGPAIRASNIGVMTVPRLHGENESQVSCPYGTLSVWQLGASQSIERKGASLLGRCSSLNQSPRRRLSDRNEARLAVAQATSVSTNALSGPATDTDEVTKPSGDPPDDQLTIYTCRSSNLKQGVDWRSLTTIDISPSVYVIVIQYTLSNITYDLSLSISPFPGFGGKAGSSRGRPHTGHDVLRYLL